MVRTTEYNREVYRRYVARLRQRALQSLGHAELPEHCPKCGEPGQLEFAHQQPTPLSGGNGRGQHRRYLDVLKHPSHYALRCKRCNAGEPKYCRESNEPIPF